jgi:hypothetical protein
VANAFISPFNTQTMHIKSFYTQQHCYVFPKTLYPGRIWTRFFSFLRRMRCPLRYAVRVQTWFIGVYVTTYIFHLKNKSISRKILTLYSVWIANTILICFKCDFHVQTRLPWMSISCERACVRVFNYFLKETMKMKWSRTFYLSASSASSVKTFPTSCR